MTLSLRPSHVARYRDLARLLAKYGRRDVVEQIGWNDSLSDEPADDPSDGDERGAELARDLERLGPTYIKLGQLLSSRVDLLPEAYTTALARLQDDVEPMPYDEVERIVADELGIRISRAFREFDERPVASASLGQVHHAVLRSGREVVVKVQRPGIRDRIRADMEALDDLAQWADKHTEMGTRYGFADLLEEFRRALAWELDYQREAQNLVALRHSLAEFTRIVVPEPVPDYTTSRVLTMDYVPGRAMNSVTPMTLFEIDGAALADELFRAYLHQVLDDGFFHADPHPGNVLVSDDGRLALVDVGQVARVPQRFRDKLVRLLVAIAEGNGEDAAAATESMGHPGPGYDGERFRRDVAELITTNASLSVGDIQAGTVLMQLTRVSGEAGLRPPPEMTMLGKALLNLDQVAHTLDPDFRPAEAIRQHASEILRKRMQPSIGSMVNSAIEARDFAVALPGRVNKVMDMLARGEFQVRVDAIDEATLLHGLQKLANRMAMGLVIAALIVGAALLTNVKTNATIWGYPALAIVCFLLAAAGGVALLLSIVLADREINRASRQHRRER